MPRSHGENSLPAPCSRPPTRGSRWLRTLLALLPCLQGIATPAAAQLYAGQLTPDNIQLWRVGGADAIAGLDDWALGNGTICAVVSDPSHESVLSSQGGLLIDLGHCGRADDQFNVLQPMLNLSRDRVLPNHDVRTEVDEREAAVVTSGEREGIRAETRYSLDLDHLRTLRVVTRLTRIGPGERLFLFGDVTLHGHRQLSPFGLSTRYPHRSVGFQHPAVDIDDNLAMVAAMVPSDLQVMVGGDRIKPGIAYGLQTTSAYRVRADGSRTPLPFLAINGEHFTLTAIFSRPFWIGGKGRLRLLEMAQTVFMDLAEGESIEYERRLHVGARADVAAVTDQLWADGPRVRGRVQDASARIHVDDADGRPITERRPETNGQFSFHVPGPGAYRVHVVAQGRREFNREFRVETRDITLAKIGLPPPARVRLPSGSPMRLVFVGMDDTPDPILNDDLLDYRVGAEAFPSAASANFVSLGGVRGDPQLLTLPAGRYRVIATRGIEYELAEFELEARVGEIVSLQIDAPRRVVPSPGWLAADLHVHSLRSDDSATPLVERLAAFVAQGGEVIVSTEHDNIVDYGPAIRRLGLGDELASLAGSEVTSTVHSEAAPHTIGHLNAFPLEPRPLQYRHGALMAENRRLRGLVATVRGHPKRPILQLNHPRTTDEMPGDGEFLSHLSVGKAFEPSRPLDAPRHASLLERDSATGLRDLDFDVIELMNGPSMSRYRATRADWFSLLLQNEYRPATANSDSHRGGEIVAVPRTYVRADHDVPADFDAAAFLAAVRKGRSYGSTGPLLGVALLASETGPATEIGGQFRGDRGTLRVSVQAAPWVVVSQLRAFVNGRLVDARPTRAGAIEEIPLEFDRDGFVTVEVQGPGTGDYALVLPGFEPFAFTNPIFVDADGDGEWQAPGLPDEPLPALRRPYSAR